MGIFTKSKKMKSKNNKQINGDEFRNWPQPNKWNPDQIEHAAEFLASTETLARLRKMQAINAQQTLTAYRLKKTKALENLHVMADVYRIAVEIKEFSS